ncbi:MAG TPA: hypothetical protein VKJ01_22920, partial [Candidatus Solibacter sp.]|nr:hypothetical protein [Candidatus Solibacter sp.]
MIVVTLVRLARRRILGNELLSQGANAYSAALAAFILLLLLGTQILSWQWTLLIPLAAVAAGVYQVRRRLPSPYVVAQIVDHRLALADTISTALYFSDPEPASRVSEGIRKSQLESAGHLAGSVDVRKAVPYTVPRTVYLVGALFLVASSLFALRYGLSKSLDLKQPLASMLPETFGGGKPNPQAADKRRNPKRNPEAPDDNSLAADNQDQSRPGEEDSTQSLDNSTDPSPESNVTAPAKGGDRKQGEQPDDRMACDDQEASGDGKSGGNSDDPAGEQGDSKANQAQNPQNSKQDAGNAGENSSLMSNMKDAMQNLLSRIKPQAGQPKSGEQQNAADQKGQAKGQQAGGKQQSKDGQQQNGNQGDAQDGQNGEEAKNSDNAQGKGSGKSDSQQASKQPGSGIGSQDGDKAIKNAEQLAAMGKISEILGKRSATISGEATVEVQTTNQQLHTPYSQKGA